MRTCLMILLFAMINVLSINAEPLISIPVANLNHDGVVTQFYGGNALVDAHAAAVSGDVITLSSGVFESCTITKGITLRGACMETTPEMEEQGMRPTIIRKFSNDMHVKVPQAEINTLKIEDIYFGDILYVDSVPHISFERVKTKGQIYLYDKISTIDAVQCSFYQITPNSYNATTAYSFVNCAISFYKYYSYNSEDTSLPYHINADHCVIGSFYVRGNSSNYSYDNEFRNCIFTYSKGIRIPVGCSADNCIALANYFFNDCVDAGNDCQVSSMAELFGDQENASYQYGGYINPLTEAAAATYLGTDGTQVGIYGGTFPFTMIPNNPIVTKCVVARQTNEDGKLKVQIEIKHAE